MLLPQYGGRSMPGTLKCVPGFFLPGTRRAGVVWEAYIAKYP